MEIIAPLRIHSISVSFSRADDMRGIVEIAFCNQVDIPLPSVALSRSTSIDNLLHEVNGRQIYRMHVRHRSAGRRNGNLSAT